MMLPGTTISPPNFLTPSRRPRLSRPFREEPPAFLCAIRHSFLVPRTPGTSDLGNPQHGLLLAMPLFAPVIVPPLLLEDDDLRRAGLLDHGGGDRGAGEQRRPSRDFGALADHQYLSELDRRPRLARELLDRNHIVLGDLVLLAAGPDHSEHDTRRYGSPRGGSNRRKRGGRGHPVREPGTIDAPAGVSISSPSRQPGQPLRRAQCR